MRRSILKCLHCGRYMDERVAPSYQCPWCGKRCVFEHAYYTHYVEEY